MATTQRTGSGSPTESALALALAQVTHRLRRARWYRHAARGGLVAVALSFLAVGLAHTGLLPEWLPLEVLIPVLFACGVGIGTLTACARPINAMTAARLAESRLGLKERLSSALEFERGGETPRDPEAALLLRLQQEDAAAHARALPVAEVVPLRMPWEARALIPAVILLLLALILPQLPVFIPPAVRTERAIVQKSGQKLVRTARLIEKRADARHMEATRRAAQAMQKLGRRMAQGRMDKKQAMVQMAQLSKQMADEQRRLAQAGSAGTQESKSLAQAGQQLAQALQQAASGPSTPGATYKPGASPHPGQGKGSHGQSGQKSGQSGAQGAGKQPGTHGFSVPNTSGKHGAGSQASKTQTGRNASGGTPEMQRAAQAMRQGDTPGLSEQLRQMAQRVQSGSQSPADQQRAAQDLQKLSDALKGTPLSQTQKHAQAAADALKHGDHARAADEMRKAADAAERETQQQNDAQGMQDAQQSLQNGRQEMAQAGKPGDIPSDAGQNGSQGQNGQSGSGGQSQMGGKSPGQGEGKFNDMGQNGSGQSRQGGAPGNEGSGDGKGATNTPGPGHYTPASGRGQKTPGHNVGVWRGAVHPLDPKFDPTKNPKYGKVYLGKGDGSGSGGKTGPLVKTTPGSPPPPGAANTSSVPYYNVLPSARKSAESAMDKEDIPPSYRNDVRQYFDSLQPPAPPGHASR